MHIILDVWDGSYRAFQAFARSPSRYGGFDAPNLAHMMAEQAVKDTVWYRAARADPEAHLPRLYRFIRAPRCRAFADALDSDAKARFKAMGASFLAHAEAAHLKWNGTTWTRARHLLGTLCLEERRQMFASELLKLLGHGAELDAALDALKCERPAPANAVDEELLAKLRAAHADGSLASTMRVWGLNGAAVTSELLLLASMPARVTEVNPELCATGTPLIFNAFKGMLFVVMTHNLTLESYVSDLANLEKIHTNTHAITLHHMFMYKKQQTTSRL